MTEKLKLGILGTAEIADRIVGAQSEHVIIAAVAGRDRVRTEKWAAGRKIPLAFHGYDSLLESKKVDAVYIPLPNSMHAEWTIKALHAGLPVLCEKPACMNPDDAAHVVTASQSTGLPVAEGFMYIFHPLFKKIFSMLEQGVIGKIRSIDSVFTWFNDDPAATPALAALGGGALADVGCYCVHLARKIAKAEPEKIAAFARKGFRMSGIPEIFTDANSVDDHMVGIMKFPDGIMARFETGISLFERHGATITGTRGSISIDRPWVQGDSPAEITLETEDGTQISVADVVDTYRMELDDFAGLVKECRKSGGLTKKATTALNDIDKNATILDTLLKQVG